MTMYVNPTDPPHQESQTREAQTRAQPIPERRRASRSNQKFVMQATPWAPGIPSVPFDVIIEDLSEVGVGVIHDKPMNVGVSYLLNVPRGSDGRSIIREYIVVRCDQRRDGKYAVGMELSTARERGELILPKKRVCSSRLKLLFLLFGIFGLLIASLAPL